GYSRLSCVIPVFHQDLVTVIDCFEEAFEFFGGCPRRVVIDGMKACVDKADACAPRFNRTFLEYANYRGFLPDAARPRHPKDKPVVENTVRFVRERFFKGETFIDLSDVARRALARAQRFADRFAKLNLPKILNKYAPGVISIKREYVKPPMSHCRYRPHRDLPVWHPLYFLSIRGSPPIL